MKSLDQMFDSGGFSGSMSNASPDKLDDLTSDQI